MEYMDYCEIGCKFIHSHTFRVSKQSYLDIWFWSDQLGETLSLRAYMKRLLMTLWDEGEGFSGKRPFGDSAWQWDVAYGLGRAGLDLPILEQDKNDEEDINWEQFTLIINEAIGDL